MAISYGVSERIEVYHFSLPVTILVPLSACVLQAFMPVKLHFFRYFDLPLLVTIFFAVARRNQVGGLLTGAFIGLLQDSLTQQPIGIYGISKTVVGYFASSVGAKLDVDNPGTRVLMTFGFYLIHQSIFLLVARLLVQLSVTWTWGHELRAAVANAIFSVVVFAALDYFRQT